MQKPLALLMELIECNIGRSSEERKLCTILDAGCGSGSASCAALLCGYNVVAVDTSQTAVDTTAERLSRGHKMLWIDVYKEILRQGKPRGAVEKAMGAAMLQPASVAAPPETLMIEGRRPLTETPVEHMTASGSNAETPTETPTQAT
jgi:SAM-dependent methyltransferase